MYKSILTSLPHKRSASRPRRPRGNRQRWRRLAPTHAWLSASPVSRSSPRSHSRTSTTGRERYSFWGLDLFGYSAILYVRVIDTLFLGSCGRAGWARSCSEGGKRSARLGAWTQVSRLDDRNAWLQMTDWRWVGSVVDGSGVSGVVGGGRVGAVRLAVVRPGSCCELAGLRWT